VQRALHVPGARASVDRGVVQMRRADAARLQRPGHPLVRLVGGVRLGAGADQGNVALQLVAAALPRQTLQPTLDALGAGREAALEEDLVASHVQFATEGQCF